MIDLSYTTFAKNSLSQNVHRCVLNYNRDEVVARRRSAGLPVNLDANEERGETAVQNTAALSLLSVQDEESKPKPSTSVVSDNSSIEAKVKVDSSLPANVARVRDSSTAAVAANNPAKETPPAETYSRAALAEAVKQPKRFKKWTKPTHGLSLSVVSRNEPGQGFNVAIVGVKNTTSVALKLIAGTPDLFLETIDDKRNSINLQSITKAHVEASEVSGSIAAGATAYYAVAYVSPVLGAHQQLRISVSQTDAADEPASLTIAKH